MKVERKIEGRVAGDFPAYRDPESLVSIQAGEHRPTQPAFSSERAFPWRAFVIALLLRLAVVIVMRAMTIGLDDMFQYDMLARSLVAGNGYRWYSLPDLHLVQKYMVLQIPTDYDPRGVLTTFRAPLYPAFLAGIYWFSGVGTGRFFAARLAQAFLNALLVPLTYWLARELFPKNPKAAHWAAWAVAFYPLLVVYPLALATENLFFLLGLGSVLALAAAANSGRSHAFVLAGFLLGLTSLTRSVFLPVAGLVALWVWLALRMRLKAVLFIFAVIATVSPWIMRNSLLCARLTGLETSLGYNLYVGYHPQSTGTFTYGPSLDLLTILDDAERDKTGTQKALEFIRAEPGRFPLLLASRLGHFFGLERRALTYFYSNNFFGAVSMPLLLTIAALILTPFIVISTSAVFGLALVRWDKFTLLLPLVSVGYLAPHLLLLSEERFHYTLVPVFAILAALCWERGSAALRARWRESRTGKIAISLAFILTECLFFNWMYELLRDANQLTLLLGPLGNQTYFPY